MTTKKIAVKESTSTKHKALHTIIAQLQTALPVLKEQLGEKKFEKRIKKAAKFLVAGIKNAPTKKTAPVVEKAIPIKKVIPVKKAIPVKKKTVKPVTSK